MLERWWDGGAWTTQARMRSVSTSQQEATLPDPGPQRGGDGDGRGAVKLVEPRQAPDTSAGLSSEIEQLKRELIETAEDVLLQEVGAYHYSHPLDTSVEYKEALKALRLELRACITSGGALTGTERWSINGSFSDGERMVRDLGKLMLRAYNTEADNVVRTLRPYKLESSIERLSRLRASITKLGAAMELRVTEEYHGLRVREIELTADYQEKREEEKQRAREERERLREEQAAERELAREHERLEKEKSHYESAIQALVERGEVEAAESAKAKLEEISSALQGIVDREANIRAGYVYVISNLGAFGDGVVKIGMTRRLEPMDRVRELGDASVPFRFDVHAIIFSDDAVSLERALHDRFADRRLNLVNPRREFFAVTPADVKDALMELCGELLSYSEQAEALEWRQSNVERSQAAPISSESER